jgi:integrase/recombinase XerC
MTQSIAAHLEWMRGEHYGENSIHDRGKCLRLAARHLPRGLYDVWPREISAFLHRPGLSAWTSHTYYGHLAGFYRWLHELGEITYDPTEDVPTPTGGQARPKPVAPDELRHALARSSDMWRTAIILAVGAGLRASEIAELERRDVTREHVHVRHGKGGRERYIETCDTVWTWVRDRPAGALVRRPYGRGDVTGKYLSCAQRRHWCSIGLPHWHLHRLRHTFCTAMLAAGHDALVLRELMGHASVVTTQGYALVTSDQRRNAVGAIDALIAGARAEV